MKSKFLSINLREIGKGLFVTVLLAILTFLKEVIDAGGDLLQALGDWRTMLAVGAGAGVSYILTTLVSNSKGAILRTEKNV